MNKISIIMSTYNGERYLKEQLDSIVAQNNKNWKLFVCDDGSTDSTVEILREYENCYHGKIGIYENEVNLGVTKNFLQGLFLADQSPELAAEYYMLSDQDDVWLPARIDIMSRHMKKMENKYGKKCPLLIFSDAEVVNETLDTIHPSYHKVQHLDTKKRDFAHLLMENKCSGCMMMINKALAEKVLVLPNKARFHDWWLALIASAFGRISYINKPTLLYRQHSGNVVGSQDFTGYLKSRVGNIRLQKKALRDVQRQAAEFLAIYSNELSKEKRVLARQLALLHRQSFFARRKLLFHYGFFKSTLIKNIGILLLI